MDSLIVYGGGFLIVALFWIGLGQLFYGIAHAFDAPKAPPPKPLTPEENLQRYIKKYGHEPPQLFTNVR